MFKLNSFYLITTKKKMVTVDINKNHAYSFLCGLFIGGWTNIVSKIIITGLVLYIIDPGITMEKIETIKNYTVSFFTNSTHRNIVLKTVREHIPTTKPRINIIDT